MLYRIKLRSILIMILFLGLVSCEDFLNPDQKLVIETEDFFKDWSEYRSAEMGMYALQQELVDQLFILGELRGDLMEITANADRDLKEVYNYQITKENKYASPLNFYKLIAACNTLLEKLETDHSEVLSDADPTEYDRLYGEVKCMRAWAYFNAVRIYGKVPYIWQGLTTVEEITDYVNSPGEYIDSVHIVFDAGGYWNDTTYNVPVVLERIFLDIDMVIDIFTAELEDDIKPGGVGVIHNKDNRDLTWDVTVWNQYALKTLLGQMYLYRGDYVKAEENFRPILYNYDSETSNIKFGLDARFSFGRWRNIFSGIDPYEHIYTLWFGKAFQQQHHIQNYCSNIAPNSYMIKPSHVAVQNWESMWDQMRVERNDVKPEMTYTRNPGIPGDFSRGYGLSYVFMKGGEIMEPSVVREMLDLKRRRQYKDVENIMSGVDTVLYKFIYGKQPYDQDANIIIYRAASVHLYAAEIYNRWELDRGGGNVIPEINFALSIVNNGSYNKDAKQMGVRGRVGFGGEKVGFSYKQDDDIQIGNIVYEFDPATNEVVGYKSLPDLLSKQEYLEDKIIEERARELAYEGDRFYDLIRIAKRRNDPSYLADKVASKFSGAKREEIRELLMNEQNWYVPFFE